MPRISARTNASSLLLHLALLAGAALSPLFAAPAWAGVIYVKAGASGVNNGTSWSNAYTDLQAALAATQSGDEIWVAQGTYKPTTGTLRTVSFVLKSEVGLYGGFAGTETDRAQRNWTTNPTILSGDIGTTDTADNSYHVVVGANLAVLDGFTITAGNANAASETFHQGGGMYNKDCSPTVANCIFSGNTAYRGGAMYNEDSSPTVISCTFSANTAGRDGGGIYNYDCSLPTVTNCTFSGNAANFYGGGMCSGGASPTVTNCTFTSNTTLYGGGGVCSIGGSPTVAECTFSGNTASSSHGGGMFSIGSLPTVTNSTFTGNTAGSGGGGGMYNTDSSPTVNNCTFTGNTASVHGGGMYNWNNSPHTVASCIFWDNTAPLGAEIYRDGGVPTVRRCVIKGSGGSGALWNPTVGVDAGGNMDADPRFVAPTASAGPDGLWRTRDDGLRLQSDSPCIGAADPAVAPATDILGLRRTSPPDIGAYEYYPLLPARANRAWQLFE